MADRRSLRLNAHPYPRLYSVRLRALGLNITESEENAFWKEKAGFQRLIQRKVDFRKSTNVMGPFVLLGTLLLGSIASSSSRFALLSLPARGMIHKEKRKP